MNSESGFMRARTTIAAAMIVTVFTACHQVPITQDELAQRATVSPCPPGIAPAKPTDAPPNASLTVVLRLDPAVPAGTEAVLRLEGPFNRDNAHIDATAAARFDLPKGVYLVRATIDGYTSVEAPAPLTAGCEATMTLVMKKPAKR